MKSLKKFEANKLEKNKFFKSLKAGCTCGTVSLCHIDGTEDGDGGDIRY